MWAGPVSPGVREAPARLAVKVQSEGLCWGEMPSSASLWAAPPSPPAPVPALVPGYTRSIAGPPLWKAVFPLQLNLCFCWKPLSCLSTTLTKFIFHGLRLRGLPRARPGNQYRAVSAQINSLLAVLSLPLAPWAGCLAGPTSWGCLRPASEWGSWWAWVSAA